MRACGWWQVATVGAVLLCRTTQGRPDPLTVDAGAFYVMYSEHLLPDRTYV